MIGIFEDIKAINRNDPAASGIQFLLYPGLWAITIHRYVSHPLYKIGFKFCAFLFCQIVRFFSQIEIHPGAKIGKGLFIDHGNGIVIGETAEIGDNCIIFHNVTIGGTGNHTGKRHPTIGNNVCIGTGATLLGPINVGNNVRIGARAVIIMRDVPSNSTIIDSPARVVKLNGNIVDMPLKKTQVQEEKVQNTTEKVWQNCPVLYKYNCN